MTSPNTDAEREELQYKLRALYKCPCVHRCHEGYSHKQSDTGCPICDLWHDSSYALTNAEVKQLLKSQKLALIAELEEKGPKDLKYKHPRLAKLGTALNPTDPDRVRITNAVNAQWRNTLTKAKEGL